MFAAKIGIAPYGSLDGREEMPFHINFGIKLTCELSQPKMHALSRNPLSSY